MSRIRHLAVPIIATAAYLVAAAATPAWRHVLGAIFPGESRLLYPDATHSPSYGSTLSSC